MCQITKRNLFLIWLKPEYFDFRLHFTFFFQFVGTVGHCCVCEWGHSNCLCKSLNVHFCRLMVGFSNVFSESMIVNNLFSDFFFFGHIVRIYFLFYVFLPGCACMF